MIFNYLQGVLNRYQQNRKQTQLTSILNDGRAVFSAFGDNVYLSDFVNNCIDRIATEVSKINIVSVVQKASMIRQQNDDITRLFRFKPNPLQTTKDFLACCEWLRRKDHNCFIYPQYETVYDMKGQPVRKYVAFYPLNPTRIEIGVDEQTGDVWEVKFWWRDGSCDILPYSDIVHLRWRRGKNTIVGGGNDNGRPDTEDLLDAVTTLDKVMQGLPAAIESSLKVNGVYTTKTLVGTDALKKTRDEFEEHIRTSKSGIVALDLAGDFTPVKVNPATINPEVLNFLKSIIRNRYGISEALLSGDYDGEQHAAFYETCIEDFITEFEQGMSACLFTGREQDVGHRVKCYYNRLEYMSMVNKVELAKLATSTGIMTLNEILGTLLGMEPFEGGDRRLQSLNYVNTQIIDTYQLQNAGSKGTQEGSNDNG